MSFPEKYKSYEDIKCLWMKCGAVDYKLCDKNFECEDCDFDKQISFELKKKDCVFEKLESVFDTGKGAISLIHPYYHSRNGLMLKNFLEDNYYLGLEPYIIKLMDKSSRMTYSTTENIIVKGDPIINISNGWGEVRVLSAFSFNFIEKLEIKNIFSQDSQWFAIIEAERSEVISTSMNKKNYFDKLYNTRMYLMNLMKTSNSVGITMHDGGTFLDNWPDILGKGTYRNLLLKLLSNDK